MVPNYLKDWLLSSRHLPRKKTVTLSLAMGGFTLAGVLLCWIIADDGKRLQAGARPSLLDLLDQVAGERVRVPNNLTTELPPKPPLNLSWSSPLKQQCSNIDKSVKKRLQNKKKVLSNLRHRIPIDDTNFGQRYRQDAYGRRIDPTPRVVILHETVYSLESAVNTFKTPHPNDDEQVSYHTLIGLDGKIADLVDPFDRAYGSGFSAFSGEWAITNKKFKGSVNNFALHLSFETPENGRNSFSTHSGYTELQYDSMALVLSDWMERFDFPAESITTHQHVDLGGERSDPRSFEWTELQKRLAALGDLC